MGTVLVYNMSTGKPQSTVGSPKLKTAVLALCFSADAQTVFVGLDTDASKKGSSAVPSNGTLQAYSFKADTGALKRVPGGALGTTDPVTSIR